MKPEEVGSKFDNKGSFQVHRPLSGHWASMDAPWGSKAVGTPCPFHSRTLKFLQPLALLQGNEQNGLRGLSQEEVQSLSVEEADVREMDGGGGRQERARKGSSLPHTRAHALN